MFTAAPRPAVSAGSAVARAGGAGEELGSPERSSLFPGDRPGDRVALESGLGTALGAPGWPHPSRPDTQLSIPAPPGRRDGESRRQEYEMDNPRVVAPEEWLAARMDLLAREKEATRAKDAVDAARRALPMTEVTKAYTFTGLDGEVGLAGLFAGHRQLITYHFMWRHEQSGFPGEDQGCPTCSFLVDSIGDPAHLHGCDTTLVLVSRAPYASIDRFKKRMGWQLPWYSSAGSDFNYDFHVSFDEGKAPLEHNYKDKETLQREAPYIRSGTDGAGVSVFLREGDRVFCTYSAYQRGLDSLLGTYRWLDLTPLGRQRHVTEFPYHDAYHPQP